MFFSFIYAGLKFWGLLIITFGNPWIIRLATKVKMFHLNSLDMGNNHRIAPE